MNAPAFLFFKSLKYKKVKIKFFQPPLPSSRKTDEKSDDGDPRI